MNIKSLLIGSAAALVAVSGARAADAIVAAEPEPVEYVRVCDAFGTGFFYIPGTETCLRVSGFVRFQLGGSRERVNGVTVLGGNGYDQNTRVRLNFDARSETEWGTLRGFARLQSDSNGAPGDANIATDQAIIQLGGLFMGYTESAFAALWGGGVGNWGLIQTDAGGSYGYQQRHQIGYRYDAGAFYAALVLEDDYDGDWTPDVVGAFGLTQGWGGAFAHIGYDESARAWGAKAGVQIDLASMNASVRIGGFYSSRVGSAYGANMPTGIITEKANWSAGIGYTQDFNDKLNGTIGYQYFDGFSTANGGVFRNAHLVQAALVWTPVTNLDIRLEGSYAQLRTNIGNVKVDNASAFLRFQRNF